LQRLAYAVIAISKVEGDEGMTTIEEIARSYWRAEASRDVDSILAHFAVDAVWRGPGAVELRGHDEIRRFYEATGRDFPGLEVEVTGVVGDGRSAALQWSAVLIDSAGGRHPCNGVNVMEGDGEHITSLQTYYDRAQIALGMDR
jgi:ketosteroid isomerase-like protein